MCPFMRLLKPCSLKIPSRGFDRHLGAWIDRKIRSQKSCYSVLACCAVFAVYKSDKTR
ncbi:hypothetical protein CAMGR0001_2326 [Campylobacter gracilis RM3268]|uniref:Uncharacterized protein n=1 Tax=Campylobacter gracilis RM3268 TaxID=553220 RepID=C8PDX7_9BACT|nr:hypothetical protein CAMGR0001_2326 [Campylobacter gracilis RM3268]